GSDDSDSHYGSEVAGGVAGEDVGAVGIGHGDQQVGVARPRLFQRGGGRPVADDDQGVERLLHLGGAVFVGFDDEDVLAFRGEELGEIGADGAGSHDDDLQDR